MAFVTLRSIDGPQRGVVYHQIPTPITLGREEGNHIQLYDERISRYHAKIHETDGCVVLTDLQSTNGTKVNGEIVQMWTLHPGDLISIGRSVLLVGSQQEIADRLAKVQSDHEKHLDDGDENDIANDIAYPEYVTKSPVSAKIPENLACVFAEKGSSFIARELFPHLTAEEFVALATMTPPSLTPLTMKETAQLTEFLQYVHLRLRYLAETVRVSPDNRITLSADQWQNVLDMYQWVAAQLHSITGHESDVNITK